MGAATLERSDLDACRRERAREREKRLGWLLEGMSGRRAHGLPWIGSREIVARTGRAQTDRKAAGGERVAHEVSNPLGAGRHLGAQPGANASITIIGAPQRGHGQARTRGAFGATSGFCCGSAAGGATSRHARAIAIVSARLPLAKSP